MQDSVPPATFYRDRPGRWVSASGFSHEGQDWWFLAGEGLGQEAGTGEVLPHRSPQSLGVNGGAWCPGGLPGDWPTDQREDDARSLCFTSQPLARAFGVLGRPLVSLEVASNQSNATICVRLCDVAPSGESLLVTRSVLDRRHRGGHERTVELTQARGRPSSWT